MDKLREAARQVVANGVQGTYAKYYSVPPADFEALQEALAEQAEQEPVAWMDLHKELGQLRWAGKDIGWDLAIDAVRNRLEELYAAPVRTKDLSDDEIEEIGKSYFDEWSFGFARAVIAADRRKNK